MFLNPTICASTQLVSGTASDHEGLRRQRLLLLPEQHAPGQRFVGRQRPCVDRSDQLPDRRIGLVKREEYTIAQYRQHTSLDNLNALFGTGFVSWTPHLVHGFHTKCGKIQQWGPSHASDMSRIEKQILARSFDTIGSVPATLPELHPASAGEIALRGLLFGYSPVTMADPVWRSGAR